MVAFCLVADIRNPSTYKSLTAGKRNLLGTKSFVVTSQRFHRAYFFIRGTAFVRLTVA